MSRVPDKIRPGDKVLWEDKNGFLESVIFSGIAQRYEGDENRWLVSNVVVHSIESTVGIKMHQFESFSRNWGTLKPDAGILKVIK